jgi:hypothetical protein
VGHNFETAATMEQLTRLTLEEFLMFQRVVLLAPESNFPVIIRLVRHGRGDGEPLSINWAIDCGEEHKPRLNEIASKFKNSIDFLRSLAPEERSRALEHFERSRNAAEAAANAANLAAGNPVSDYLGRSERADESAAKAVPDSSGTESVARGAAESVLSEDGSGSVI